MRLLSLSILSILGFALFLPAAAQAQGGRAMAAAKRVDEFSKQTDKVAHDQMESEMRGRKPSKEELKKIAQAKAETKEDLEALQSSYNEIIGALNSGGPSADFVLAIAGKINKSASRLRSNVPAIPKPKDPPSISEITDSRAQSRELATKIYRFLTNPIIETPAVVEAEAAAKAGSDLEWIIVLSERLKAKGN